MTETQIKEFEKELDIILENIINSLTYIDYEI